MQILDTGVASAEENMRFDEELLEGLAVPTLHLYQWALPSATYGYFIKPEKHLDLGKAAGRGLDLARRPTGGGIVFHIWDVAFSFLMPSNHPAFSQNTLENYQFVNRAVLEAMRTLFVLREPVELIAQNGPNLGPDCQNFCMAKPTQYDVVHKGMKIAGAAQRKRRQGYLHQGTIALAKPDFGLLNEVLLSKSDVLAAMMTYSFAPLERVDDEVRQDLQKLLADKLNLALNS
ncbi:MAG TPA: lipoate--protein ligase family protein [Chlamydiales bacterium]|nr:lipoate--protein ligase family protein [Chlamydiales bacterium]